MSKRKSYLEHAAVTVEDMKQSVDFFTNALGMKITRTKDENGKLKQVWLDGGLQLVALEKGEKPKAAHHLGIVVNDYDAVLKELLSYEGVTHIDGKPDKWLKLPNGITLELFQERPDAIDKVSAVELK